MKTKKIVVWGAGKHAESIADICTLEKKLQCEIICFIDSDLKKQGMLFRGTYVFAPKDIYALEYDALVIGTTGKKREEIEEQLYNMKCNKYSSFLTDKINYYILKRKLWNDYTAKYITDYINVGAFSYGIPEVIKFNNESGKLFIGKFCSIASGVKIWLGGNHKTEFVSTYPFSLWLDGNIEDHYSKGDVIIGNDVWIGADVKILSGVKIGDGAVLAANAVITKDVEPYTIWGGNPARLIRYRFSKEEIGMLEKIEWWDWNDDLIIKAMPILQGNSIYKLYEFYQNIIRNNG